MSTLERRLDRLEEKINPTSCEGWCCASEADAQGLIARLRAENSPPPLLFITGGANSDGSSCWRIEGRTVAELWRAIDRFAPEPPRVEPASPDVEAKAAEDISDEVLLSIISKADATLVLNRDGSHRFLEAGELL
jgi:hypothetical protein